MEKVRFGIVGIGSMGSHHMGAFSSVPSAVLAAGCDTDPEKRQKAAQHNVPIFATHQELFDSGLIDAVLIATPHYDHPPIAIDAFARGIHVLSEKPIAVSVKAARELIKAYEKYPKLKFGIMFQMRTSPLYQKARELVAGGELGEISRITWLITAWFRTWSYYASGGWRATWKGEGGGVLINQCPHNLDLLQWIPDMMPIRATAVGAVGRTHPIEVEDDISAILEYPNGAMGHFVTTTGEAPGTNRLEIAGDRGKMIVEGGKVTFFRTRTSVREVRETSPLSFPSVETWEIDVPIARNKPEGHYLITQNFAEAILNDTPLIAPGVEGIRGLEIGNAILMSGLTRRPVDLPVDGDAYDRFIDDMGKKYGGKKTLQTGAAAGANFANSFAKP